MERVMQPSSLASAVTYASSSPDIATQKVSAGRSGGYSVALLPATASFFSSLSPRWECAHRGPPVSKAGQVPDKTSWADTGNDIAGKVKMVCNLTSCWVPQLQVACEAVATLCSSLTLTGELARVLAQKENKKCTAASGAGVVTLIVLDRMAGAAAVPAPGERGSPQQPIEVPDSETLARIGRDDRYPADACYRQTNSFSHDGPGVVFQGHYEGGCHTITNLQSCLFSKLDRCANVQNLRLADASIEKKRVSQVAALACEMDSYSSARNIAAQNISVHTHATGGPFEPVAVGVITGHQRRAAEVSNIQLRQCEASASDDYAAVGLVAGLASGDLKNINVTRGHTYSTGFGSPTGIGAGDLRGTIDNMQVSESRVVTYYRNSPAGIGAGIVRRDGHISRLAVVGSRSIARGGDSASGIGAGKTEEGSLLQGLTMLECRSKTDRTDAPAGIGTGFLGGEIKDMVSIGSLVVTVSPGANAAIGAGDNMGQINGLTTINDTVRAQYGRTGIASGRGKGSAHATLSYNTRTGQEAPDSKGLPDLSQLCARGDVRFLAADCQIVHAPMAISPWSCPSNDLPPTCNLRWQPIENGNMTIDTARGQADNPCLVQPDPTPVCPMLPLNITAVATAAPAAAAGISVGTVGLVAGSALLLGAGVLGAYFYHLYRQTRETLAEDEGSDYSRSSIECENRMIPDSIH